MALACTGTAHLVGTVCRSSPRRRMDGFPSCPGQHRQTAAVGTGPNVDLGKRPDLPAGTPHPKPHSCRGARSKGCALCDGGGRKMLLSFGRDRRTVGRSARTRFYRDPAACGRVGAERHALLACKARRQCKPQRREDAMADRERALTAARTRSPRSWNAGLGYRTISRTWNGPRPLDRRS